MHRGSGAERDTEVESGTADNSLQHTLSAEHGVNGGSVYATESENRAGSPLAGAFSSLWEVAAQWSWPPAWSEGPSECPSAWLILCKASVVAFCVFFAFAALSPAFGFSFSWSEWRLEDSSTCRCCVHQHRPSAAVTAAGAATSARTGSSDRAAGPYDGNGNGSASLSWPLPPYSAALYDNATLVNGSMIFLLHTDSNTEPVAVNRSASSAPESQRAAAESESGADDLFAEPGLPYDEQDDGQGPPPPVLSHCGELRAFRRALFSITQLASGGITSRALNFDEAEQRVLTDFFWPQDSSPRNRTPAFLSQTFTTNRRYPLTLTMLQRGYTPAWGHARERMDVFFRKLAASKHWKQPTNRTVDVVIMGGSMTFGHDCGDSECAWPTRFEEWLGYWARAAGWRVRLFNSAIPGVSPLQRAHMPIHTADMYVIDLTVNNMYGPRPAEELGQRYEALLWRLWTSFPRAAIISMHTFRTCGAGGHHCECGDDHRKVPGTDYEYCPHWHETPGIEINVARSYGVPLASYRDTVWPVLFQPPRDLPVYWSGHSHPDQASHELVSDSLKYAWMREMVATFCPQLQMSLVRLPVFTETKQLQTCISHDPTTLYDAQIARVSGNTSRLVFPAESVGDTWSFTADSRNKYGWIHAPLANHFTALQAATGGVGSDGTRAENSMSPPVTPLNFRVAFGSHGQLEVSVLRSYTGFGRANISIEGCSVPLECAALLSGRWPDHEQQRISIPVTAFYKEVGDGDDTKSADLCPIKCQNGLKDTMRRVTFIVHEADALLKYKLVALYAC